MPGSCWCGGVLNLHRSAQSLAERSRWTLSIVPSAGLIMSNNRKNKQTRTKLLENTLLDEFNELLI
jgi:hypothetical protein